MPSNPETIPQRLIDKCTNELKDYCDSIWTFFHQNKNRRYRSLISTVISNIADKKLTTCGEVLNELKKITQTTDYEPSDDLVQKIAEIKNYRLNLLTSTDWFNSNTALMAAVRNKPDTLVALLHELYFMSQKQRAAALSVTSELNGYTVLTIAIFCNGNVTLPSLFEVFKSLEPSQLEEILKIRCHLKMHALMYAAKYNAVAIPLFLEVLVRHNNFMFTCEMLCTADYLGNNVLMMVILHQPQAVFMLLDFIDRLSPEIKSDIFSKINFRDKTALELAALHGLDSPVYLRVLESFGKMSYPSEPSSSSHIEVIYTDEDDYDEPSTSFSATR